MRSSNILKKITAAGLAAVMLFAAAACSPENDNDTAEKSSSVQEAELVQLASQSTPLRHCRVDTSAAPRAELTTVTRRCILRSSR